MDSGRELGASLAQLLYAVAEDDVDDEATDSEEHVWVGLLRDGAEIARRLTEEIDADDWAAVRDAVGVIVRRDAPRHDITAHSFLDEEDLVAEWEATRADLVNTAAIEEPEMGDSTEGPSSGPLPPREDT